MKTPLIRSLCLIPYTIFTFIALISYGRAEVLARDLFAVPDGPLVDAAGWYAGKSSVGEVLRSEERLFIKQSSLVWEGSPDITNALFCRRIVAEAKKTPPVIFVGFVINVETPPLRGKFADIDNLGSTFFSFSNSAGSSHRGHLGVAYGQGQGMYRLSLGDSSNIKNSDVLPFEYYAGEDVRVVMAYNSSQRIVSIWINPSGREDEPSLRTSEIKSLVDITSIAFRMRNHSRQDLGSFRVSRLVAATTFSEAMP